MSTPKPHIPRSADDKLLVHNDQVTIAGAAWFKEHGYVCAGCQQPLLAKARVEVCSTKVYHADRGRQYRPYRGTEQVPPSCKQKDERNAREIAQNRALLAGEAPTLATIQDAYDQAKRALTMALVQEAKAIVAEYPVRTHQERYSDIAAFTLAAVETAGRAALAIMQVDWEADVIQPFARDHPSTND